MSKGHALYEKCQMCDGTRKSVKEFSIPACGPVPIGSPCPFCKTGYHEIGMTDTQLVAALDERDALLSFVGRVADGRGMYATEIAKTEAQAMVRGKGARIAEYRMRKGLDVNTGLPVQAKVGSDTGS